MRTEVEITTHLIVQEIKEMILVLEKSSNTSLTQQEGKPIMDAMKSLRKMLEGEKIPINTTQILFELVGDIYRYTYRQLRVYLPVHLAAIASIDSHSNSCGVDCTDRQVYSLGLFG